MTRISKTPIATVCAIICVAQAFDANADDAPADATTSHGFDNALLFGIGIGYENFDTNIKLTENSTGRHVFVDLESSLGLAETKAIPLIYGYYRPGKKHGFGWSFSRVRRDGDVFAIDENFGDLNVSGNISISDRTTFYDVSYNYTAYEDDRAFIFASIGLYGLDLKYNLTAVGNITYQGDPVASGRFEEDVSQFAPLPLIGLDAWFSITAKWMFGAKVSLIGGSYDDLSAFVMYSKIRANYMLSDRFGVDFGVNYFDADVTIDKGNRRSDIRYGFSGFRAGINYRF